MAHQKNQTTRVCPGCGKEFSMKASCKQIYCSKKCRHESSVETIACLQCGKLFTTRISLHSKFCSISCGMTFRDLGDQNPSHYRDLSGSNNPMFGKKGLSGEANPMFGKTRENNPSWKGGRKVRKDGYVFIRAPEGHPNPGKYGYVLEHRLVMEKMLGRYLETHEVVHHLDGDPGNNAPENLELFGSQSDHIHVGHGHG